jgi:hypothetical protein
VLDIRVAHNICLRPAAGLRPGRPRFKLGFKLGFKFELKFGLGFEFKLGLGLKPKLGCGRGTARR